MQFLFREVIWSSRLLERLRLTRTKSGLCRGGLTPRSRFVCVLTPQLVNWMTSYTPMFKIFDHCEKIVGLPDIGACVSNDTYEFDDFIKGARVGPFYRKSPLADLSTPSLRKEDLTCTPYGRHFTLKLRRTITRKESNFVLFKMDTNPDLFYSIWVHDEKYFLININPFRKKMCENELFWCRPQTIFFVHINL